MRKIAIGLVAGAAALASPALAADAKPAAKVEAKRPPGGSTKAMTKQELKEHKTAPSEVKLHQGAPGAKGAERAAPKKI